jgi:hypothetical protein
VNSTTAAATTTTTKLLLLLLLIKESGTAFPVLTSMLKLPQIVEKCESFFFKILDAVGESD